MEITAAAVVIDVAVQCPNVQCPMSQCPMDQCPMDRKASSQKLTLVTTSATITFSSNNQLLIFSVSLSVYSHFMSTVLKYYS